MKPEYDEAAEILNKGADVSLSTFLCLFVYSMHIYRPVCFISQTLLSTHRHVSLADHNNPSFLVLRLLAVAA